MAFIGKYTVQTKTANLLMWSCHINAEITLTS